MSTAEKQTAYLEGIVRHQEEGHTFTCAKGLAGNIFKGPQTPCSCEGVEYRTIAEWQTAVHELAKSKGWWDPGKEKTFGDAIMLMVTELSEAYEEFRVHRKPTETYYSLEHPTKPLGIPTELADCVIRILDYCEYAGINLQAAMAEKHAYNATRAYRHGGKAT